MLVVQLLILERMYKRMCKLEDDCMKVHAFFENCSTSFIEGLVSCKLASEVHGYLLELGMPLSFKLESRRGGIIIAEKYYIPVCVPVDGLKESLILDWNGITVLP